MRFRLLYLISGSSGFKLSVKLKMSAFVLEFQVVYESILIVFVLSQRVIEFFK